MAVLVPGIMALAACTRVPAGTTGASSPPSQTPAAQNPAAKGQVAAAGASTAAPEPKVEYVGRMALQPNHGPAGTRVTASGSGLPLNTQLQLVWNTVKGEWLTSGEWGEEYHGRRFTPVTRPMQMVTTDAAGHFEATFTAPQDFGFSHDVTLVDKGVIRNKAAFSIDPVASLSASSGPVGTPIGITLSGVGWQNLENSWTLVYDNKFTGWLSSVTTGGQAKAVIPATGSPGKHVIQIIHGAFTVPYMNMQQSPQPDRPSFTMTFTVTPGAPVLPPVAASQALPAVAGAAPAGTGPAIWTNPAAGPVGTPFRLEGRGLPAGKTVDLLWARVKGSRVSGNGWDEETIPLGKVQVDAAGHTVLDGLKAPDDLGDPHRIVARLGDQSLAQTTFTITPSALPVEPASGPVGTNFLIHLKGVGWTETANIYLVVYDNAYIGYACGFNSQGDVQVFLKATGDPGWHFIDLYPGIYKGQEMAGVQNFRIPQLTAADDHPLERLPVFRFAFRVTEK